MLIFKSDKGYGVYLEDDGDDLWITVTNGYCKSYDCFAGSVADAYDIRACLETAYTCFFPAQYVSENLNSNDDSLCVLYLAKDAYEIGRALELARIA